MKNDLKETVNQPQQKFKPHLSANTFFHYSDQLKHITEALERKKLYPRYSLESFDFLENIPKGLEKLLIPMICFCDIKLRDSNEHLEFYGKFGLGFQRSWGYQNGIESINYIDKDSKRAEVIVDKINKTFNENLAEINPFNQLEFLDLMFLKPFYGKTQKRNRSLNSENTVSSNQGSETKTIIKYFADENESRYIPNLSNSEFQQLIGNSSIQQWYFHGVEKLNNATEILNDKLKQSEVGALNFEYSDLKYIIVQNIEDKEKLLDFIINNLNELNIREKLDLAQKIQIWNESQEDY